MYDSTFGSISFSGYPSIEYIDIITSFILLAVLCTVSLAVIRLWLNIIARFPGPKL